MRYKIIIILIALSMFACNTKPDISGTWIEVGNYNNPAILKYWDDKVYQYEGFYQDNAEYSLSKDLITYSSGNKVEYTQGNDTLTFIFDSTSRLILAKMEHDRYYKYLFEQLGVAINLPAGNAEQITYKSLNNFITLHEKDDSVRFSFNGEFYNLDTFTLEYDSYEWDLKNNLLYIDSSTRMKHVNYLEQVFTELNLLRITYIVNDNRGNKYRLPTYSQNFNRLRFLNEKEVPPPLPPPAITLYDASNTIYLFQDNTIFENGVEVSEEDMTNNIKELALSGNKSLLLLCISDNYTYSEYIEIFAAVNNIYAIVRDSASLNKYNMKYSELEASNAREIRKMHPKRIIKITNEQYKDIIRNR